MKTKQMIELELAKCEELFKQYKDASHPSYFRLYGYIMGLKYVLNIET
jgi:hypothetical protein